VAATDSTEAAGRLGFSKGQRIQELGYDDDVEFDLREAIEDLVGTELADEDWDDVTDGAFIWWRSDDGDLTDPIVDALTIMEDGGLIWVLTPKAGRPGHVDPAEVADAATTTGLHATSSIGVGPEWIAFRLTRGGRGAAPRGRAGA
jgi:hypothetical protein